MDIAFVHGLTYDPHTWDRLKTRFNGHTIHTVNLGHTEASNGESISIEEVPENSVVIGHSLGTMRALKDVPKMKAFVSIAGFSNFAKHQKSGARILAGLAWGMPKAGMWHFRRNLCEDNDPLPEFNMEGILQGLRFLIRENAEDELKGLNTPVLALAARDDKVVSKRMSLDSWRSHDLRWSEDGGGHMLQNTRTEWCAKQIHDFFQKHDLR